MSRLEFLDAWDVAAVVSFGYSQLSSRQAADSVGAVSVVVVIAVVVAVLISTKHGRR